jgi:predicted transcriptional regulator
VTTGTKKIVALTLRLPEEMLASLDQAAWQKRMTRTAFIRESLARNLAYFLDVESRAPMQEQSGE